MTKIFKRLLSVLLILALCSGCAAKNTHEPPKGAKLQIMTSIFPIYDFTKNIAGEFADVILLLPPGAESHTYEPAPQDLIRIQNSSLFIYIGGESDSWVERLKSSLAPLELKSLKLIESVSAVFEEYIEGMEFEALEHDFEYDEHIWTSPKNSMLMVKAIRDALIDLDSTHEAAYRENANNYIAELEKLDKAFLEASAHAKNRTLVFGSRFPFRYFVDEYGLLYYAAFPGCASNTEPSAATVAFLTDKVREENIPVVFHTEFANEQIADIICEATGAKKLLLHSCHNVSQLEFESGASYLSLMYNNLQALKEALE